jgi:hypothetical protein
MLNLKAEAHRHGDNITVLITGDLPDSCSFAEYHDKYPGGHIQYVRDPGFAQVFINEGKRPGPCADGLVPWSTQVEIRDTKHTEVQIKINMHTELTVPVHAGSGNYIVYKLTGGINPSGSCTILPAESHVLSVWSKVFGPASDSVCLDWVKQHCPGGR